MADNPFAQFVQTAPPSNGIVPLGSQDPGYQYKGQQAGADVSKTQTDTAHTQVQTKTDLLTQPYAATKAAGDASTATSNAVIAAANARKAQGIPVPLTPQQRSDQMFEDDATLKNISDARNLAVNGHGAGMWSFLNEIPGTDALSLNAKLDAIKSDESLANMAKARQDSPSGSLGMRITNFEAGLFANKFGSLNQKQSPADLAGSLDTIAKFYKRNRLAAAGIDPDSVSLDAPQPPGVGSQGPQSAPGAARPPIGALPLPGAPTLPPGGSGGPPGNPPTGGMPPTAGGPFPGPGPTLPPYFSGPSTPGGSDSVSLAQGSYRSEPDPALAGVNGHVSDMLRSGASADDIRRYFVSVGVDPSQVSNIDSALNFRSQHPEYHGNYTVDVDKRLVPMNLARSTFNALGQSPVGAFAMGAGDAATLGTLDNMTSNPALARAAMAQIEANNPISTLSGMATGGAAAGGVVEGLLAKLGIPAAATLPGGFSIAPRAIGTDAAIGGGYSAGSADDGNRLGAGLFGAVTGAGVGAAGRKLTAGLASAAAPTGGELAPIYAAGVRPTLGQRFANSGAIGKTANTVEQAVQSIPLAGGVVRSARDASRDQFERGAFNLSLADLKPFGNLPTKLPDDMQLGTQPHAFLQQATNDAYSRARSGMQLVPDGQMSQDLGDFQRFLQSGAFSDDDVKSVNNLIMSNVGTRLGRNGGVLSGDNYKSAVADLNKAALSMSVARPQAAQAVSDFTSILDSAARRSSSPGAADLMDAADSAYAKQVRIEQAAAARGGDTGRFTPTQFDRAVQQSSGGVRSRAYLRGDALMGDYANAGKSLVDTLPDSGTPIRGLVAGGALGGLAHLHPLVAASTVASISPYLPGVRSVVSGAMAPTANVARKALAAGLKRNKGMFGNGAVIPALQFASQGR